MLLSVIVPVYNAEKYLEECLDSIVNQSFRDLEIILVDDGSTDESYKVCQKYKRLDTRIKIVRQENSGLVKARKVGLSMATAPYATFVDADDWLSKDAYERIVQLILETDVDIITCGFISETEKEQTYSTDVIESGIYEGDDLVKNIYSKMLFVNSEKIFGIKPSLCLKVFKREIINQAIEKEDERITIGEDLACSYYAMLLSKKIAVTDLTVYHYRRREGSMSTTIDSSYFEKIGLLYNYVHQTFLKHELSECLINQLNNYMALMLEKGRVAVLGKKGDVNHFLFPFSEVKKEDRVILYGAGNVGQQFYRQISKEKYCHIVKWVDRKYGHSINDFVISNPKEITSGKYDKIIIAIADNVHAEPVSRMLQSWGIDRSKIIWKNYYIH